MKFYLFFFTVEGWMGSTVLGILNSLPIVYYCKYKLKNQLTWYENIFFILFKFFILDGECDKCSLSFSFVGQQPDQPHSIVVGVFHAVADGSYSNTYGGKKKEDICRHYKISFLNQAEYFSVKKDFRKKFDVRQTADDQI